MAGSVKIRPIGQTVPSAPQPGPHGPLQRSRGFGAEPQGVPSIVGEVLRSGGQPLDAGARSFFEPRLGHDFSQVRVHDGAEAAESARAVNAHAYTVGSNLVFGRGRYAPATTTGQRLLAHELTHVVQQGRTGASANAPLAIDSPTSSAENEAHGAANAIVDRSSPIERPATVSSVPMLHRYEAGEHAEIGEAGDELKALVAKRAFTYTVKKGDTLESIATKLTVSPDDIRGSNADKIKKKKTKTSEVEVFKEGEVITIPPQVNEAVKDALKTKELTFVVGKTPIAYGEGIATGDFYADLNQMLTAPETELLELQRLIQKDKKGPAGIVTTAEWDKATGNRYHDLATKNDEHFGPPNAAYAPTAGKGTGDHKSTWERYHAAAIKESQGGAKDKALASNAFADHFLTDAFAAGHLTNKGDVMELFKSNLPLDKDKNFLPSGVTFFDAVAAKAFVGAVRTEFSRYETVEWKGVVFRPNINSPGRFSKLLQGIHKKRPDLLSNAVAKSVHDTLNHEPGGVPVENSMGAKWSLSGDGTLNTDTRNVARQAVAQSQLNVLDAYKSTTAIDLPAAYKRVWDYVPRPTAAGTATVASEVKTGVDPTSVALIDAIVKLITDNYLAIIDELVNGKEKVLKLT